MLRRTRRALSCEGTVKNGTAKERKARRREENFGLFLLSFSLFSPSQFRFSQFLRSSTPYESFAASISRLRKRLRKSFAVSYGTPILENLYNLCFEFANYSWAPCVWTCILPSLSCENSGLARLSDGRDSKRIFSACFSVAYLCC